MRMADGSLRDTCAYSIIASEWPAVRANLSLADGKAEGRLTRAQLALEAQGKWIMLTIAEKRARFAELHAAPGCFVIPNPFDIGSAKYLASLGFPALASTSAGMAFVAGKGDGAVDRAYTLSHLRDLAEATDLPLNADFEAGFARDADGVHESARLCVGAGVSGFSIEDYTGNPARSPL